MITLPSLLCTSDLPLIRTHVIACGAHQDSQSNLPTSRPLMTPTKFSCLPFSLYKVTQVLGIGSGNLLGAMVQPTMLTKGIETHPKLGWPSLSSVVGKRGRMLLSLNTVSSGKVSQRSLAHGGALMPTFGDYITTNR